MSDPVNHPRHYTEHPSGVECIAITRHMGFNLGNAIKYIGRASLNNGVEDLRKAVWYLNDEIQRLERNAADSNTGAVQTEELSK
jgi:hypothetical protein